MKYNSFEDLPVWQAAIELARRTYALTEHHTFRGHAGLRDQLERAALSVSNPKFLTSRSQCVAASPRVS